MNLTEHPEIKESLEELTRGMLEYMEDGPVNYTEEDVQSCREILVAFIDALKQAKSREAAKDVVKSTVLQLNTLNEVCEGELIETDQREEICGLIINATALLGFNESGADLTEEWREW